MRYAYDTEFLEDGWTVELISIGIVADDGRELYRVNLDAPWKRIYRHDWLCTNVVRWLPRIHGDRRLQAGKRNPYALDFHHPDMQHHKQIAADVLAFFGEDPDVELWADCGAYDHVVLMQLFGPMVDKPAALPYFTCDLQQVLRTRLQWEPSFELPPDPPDAHNALFDARHLMACLRALDVANPDAREDWTPGRLWRVEYDNEDGARAVWCESSTADENRHAYDRAPDGSNPKLLRQYCAPDQYEWREVPR